MRILLCCYDAVDNSSLGGGGAVRNIELGRRWVAKGHDITFLCGSYPGCQDGTRYDVLHKHVGSGGPRPWAIGSFTYMAVPWIRRHAHEYDVIIEDFMPYFPTLLGRLVRTPVVLQVQNWLGAEVLRRYGPLCLHAAIAERSVPNLYDHCVVLTDEMRHLCVRGRFAHCEVIGQGVDEAYGASDGVEHGRDVLFLGRMDIFQKGLDVLARAWREVRRHIPTARLRLVGVKPSEESRMRRLFRCDDDMVGSVQLCPWVRGEDKRRTIAECGVLVLPSRHEGQGIVLIEAAAMGKPAVVSDISSLRWAVRAGFAVGSCVCDPGSLADSLVGLLSNDEHRAQLSIEARKYAARHTWAQVADRYERYLRDVVDHQGGPCESPGTNSAR